MKTYAVKELYYTLQGEGGQAGRAAVFLRFAGCNLWNGLESGRAHGQGGCSRWCDTDFVGTNGPGGGKFTSPEQLARVVRAAFVGEGGQPLVVCTGGEPLLQLDEPLVRAFHDAGLDVAIETNGTLPVPEGVDWVCVSPKAGSTLVVDEGSELKLVYPQQGFDPSSFSALKFDHFFLQPLDNAERAENTQSVIAYCQAHPQWRLSLQTHKMTGIR